MASLEDETREALARRFLMFKRKRLNVQKEKADHG
jgi:hypothetical protein